MILTVFVNSVYQKSFYNNFINRHRIELANTATINNLDTAPTTALLIHFLIHGFTHDLTRVMRPLSNDEGTTNMKAALLVMALCGFSAFAMADENTNQAATQNIPVEQYTYGTHLDIAKVISMTEIPDVCHVVPARMVYQDSKGVEHILQYQVMGNGCENG
jgi:hypothetical protein